MAVLAEHGRAPATSDLAERFLLHAVVDEQRDVRQAQREGLTVHPERVAEVDAGCEALAERFGQPFLEDFGWARPLFPALPGKRRVGFDALERLADTGLARSSYRQAAHHLHASAWGAELNLVERAGTTYRTTGPTNLGLVQPVAVAVLATLAAAEALVWGVEEQPGGLALVGLLALHHVGARAVDLFVEGEAVVEAREARLQARGKTRRPAD